MAKASETQAEIIRAAREYVEENGAGDLTLRVLGEQLGMHHTAMYRHFKNKDELLAAVFMQLSSDLLTRNASIKDPKKRLLALGLEMRKVQAQYPELASSLANSTGGGQHGSALQQRILDSLRQMGVPEKKLAVRYQAIESFVNGASYYDFAGAPTHNETRRSRHRAVGDPALDGATRTDADTAALTEEAFAWGLAALLEQATS